jgi:hypothetical protein
MGRNDIQRAVHGVVRADEFAHLADKIKTNGECREFKLLRKRIDDAIDKVYAEATDMFKDSIRSTLNGYDYASKHELLELEEIASEAFEVGFDLDHLAMTNFAKGKLLDKDSYTYEWSDQYGKYVLFTIQEKKPVRYIAIIESIYAIPCERVEIKWMPHGKAFGDMFGLLMKHRPFRTDKDDQVIALALAPEHTVGIHSSYHDRLGKISPLGNLSEGTFNHID